MTREEILKRYPLSFLVVDTPEKLARLWENVRQFPLLFDDFTWGNVEVFVGMLQRTDAHYYAIGDVGVAWLLNTRPGATADFFVCYWGPCSHDAKMEIFKIITRDAFYRFNLKRVGITCYAQNVPIVKMCEEAGVHLDGILRKALMLRGELCDVHAYSYMREEAFEWAGREEYDPDLIRLPIPPDAVVN